jgi:Iron-sulfur cluster-binding domain
MIVPSMIKAMETLNDLEPFVDEWQRKIGAYVVRGASHYAKQRQSRAVTSMSPPKREACRRVFSRMLVLADGCVTTCDQDYQAKQAIGSLRNASIAELWKHDRLEAIRSLRHSDCALCPACDEWHRP